MRFSCATLFDITATSVTGHFKPTNIPFTDAAGHVIDSAQAWNHARNQQRNWETVTQLIGMRTQIQRLTTPIKQDNKWYFEFEVDTPAVFGPEENPVSVLQNDSIGIPMLVDLDNEVILNPRLVPDYNIWFKQIP
jgi:hypothetical protein